MLFWLPPIDYLAPASEGPWCPKNTSEQITGKKMEKVYERWQEAGWHTEKFEEQQEGWEAG